MTVPKVQQKYRQSLFANQGEFYCLYGTLTHRSQRPADHHDFRDTNALVLLAGIPGTSVIAFWHTLVYSCIILLPAFSLCSPNFPPVSHLASHVPAGSLSHPPRGASGEMLSQRNSELLTPLSSEASPLALVPVKNFKHTCHPHPLRVMESGRLRYKQYFLSYFS